jgi:hypothetical protein
VFASKAECPYEGWLLALLENITQALKAGKNKYSSLVTKRHLKLECHSLLFSSKAGAYLRETPLSVVLGLTHKY